MPWCPKCKNEYVEGTKECADCGTTLVETLVEKTVITDGEKEKMEKLKEFLEYSKLEEVSLEYNEAGHTYQIMVKEEDEYRAKKMINTFLIEEAKSLKEEEDFDTDEESDVTGKEDMSEADTVKHAGVYQNSATKAEDNKSSAYTLLFVGGVGLVVIILCMTGVIRLNLSDTSQYMVYGVMGTLFILFLVMGVLSMRSYKVFAQKAKKEDNLTEEIQKWCFAELKAADIDRMFEEDGQLSEEIKYFKRAEIMKTMINEKFLNLDEAYLEHFIDEIYPEIFEKEAKEA